MILKKFLRWWRCQGNRDLWDLEPGDNHPIWFRFNADGLSAKRVFTFPDSPLT